MTLYPISGPAFADFTDSYSDSVLINDPLYCPKRYTAYTDSEIEYEFDTFEFIEAKKQFKIRVTDIA